MDDKNEKHASPSCDDEARVFEIGDTPTLSRQNSNSKEIDVSAKNRRTPGSSLSAIQPPVGFDPARIPASVFAAKSSTPMEWSFASNESLFSIHVGNTSFSKDQFLNMFRSGELAKFDHELARFSGVVNSDQINYASEITDGIRTPSDVSKDRFDWSYNATAQPFQFPVLVGNYDSGMISSPKMDPRRHRGTDKWNSSPTQASSSLQMIHSGEQSRSKRNEHDTSNWLLCLTCCFKPCR